MLLDRGLDSPRGMFKEKRTSILFSTPASLMLKVVRSQVSTVRLVRHVECLEALLVITEDTTTATTMLGSKERERGRERMTISSLRNLLHHPISQCRKLDMLHRPDDHSVHVRTTLV